VKWQHIKAFLKARDLDSDRPNEYDFVTSTRKAGKRALDVNMAGPLSSFGELLVVEPTPQIQVDALEGGENDSNVETFTAASGSVTVKDDHNGKEFQCSTGTDSGGYGLIRSKYIVRYRAGQGAKMRFTARWGQAGVANSAMRAGGINAGTELSFGYNDTTFGILYRTGGRLEIQTLTISAAASGNETLTLTLNGTDYTISLTSGTAAFNAYEIVTDNSFSAAYSAYQNGDTVVFVAKAVGPQTGAFTFSSTGTATGTFAETANGVAVSDTFIAQTSWNITTLTDASTDPFVLNPLKGNVFQILFQYLGYGAIVFEVENPDTGHFTPVHMIKYANNNTSPSLDSPFFKIGCFAASLGSTTDLSIFQASMAGFVAGKVLNFKNPVGHSNTKTNVGTTLTNIISFRVRNTFNGYVNLAETNPIDAFFAVDGTKPAVIEIHINATIAGTPNWTYHNESVDLMEYDTAGTTVSGALEVTVVAIGKTGNVEVDLKKMNIKLAPNDVITLAAKATSGTTDVTASLTWQEQ
jgi:hypothetical protein